MSIEIANIKKSFGRTQVLNDISLDIPSGQMVALLGPSGSGKTTLLRIIAGLEHQTSGHIRFHGTDVSRLHARDRKVGFVFQHYALFRHMTVFDNIAFGLTVLPRRERPNAAAIKAKVTKLLEMVQLAHLADRYPAQLSGGQKQRVALARILVYEPDVIMLDEPFSALDYYLKEQLQFQVREVLRGYTGDVLMVSHSRDEVYRFCEKSIILNRGQVAMKGETRAIFQKPENVTAARLTGCKNFSRIRRIGEYEVEALDWGLTLQTEEAVAADHAYIGIRAHQFYPARGSANEFTCEWGDTLCQPFEWDVLLRPVENAGAAGDKENALEREVIWWKVDYKQSDSLNRYQRGDRVRLGIAPGDIMLLKEG